MFDASFNKSMEDHMKKRVEKEVMACLELFQSPVSIAVRSSTAFESDFWHLRFVSKTAVYPHEPLCGASTFWKPKCITRYLIEKENLL